MIRVNLLSALGNQLLARSVGENVRGERTARQRGRPATRRPAPRRRQPVKPLALRRRYLAWDLPRRQTLGAR